MVFASPTFLFLFLPLFFLGYFLLPWKLRSAWILAGSWLFYGWWRLDILLLLVGASLGAGLLGRRIAHARTPRMRRIWTRVGVVAALALLGFFKYFNFFLDSLSGLARLLVGPAARPGFGAGVPEVLLPVGISFFTFQIISYLIDVSRRTVPAARSLVDVSAYVSLFPQLVAGPIVRYSEISDQLRERSIGLGDISEGIRRFGLGLVRKVLIADAVAPVADAVYGLPAPGFLTAWLGLTAYSLQIYFDFSAYSDMAIGLGRIMGFRFPENFRQPYHSRSIQEFWRRWHMTLSAWLRDYLYIPLGGSRLSERRTLINLMTVMLLGGLWHGAAWTFVLWGLWHGSLLIAERLLAPRSLPGGRVTVLLAVMLGWVFFRAASFAEAGQLLAGLVGAGGWGIAPELIWRLTPGRMLALLAGVLLVVAEPRIFRDGRTRPLVLLLLVVLAIARLLAASFSPFLYFQF